MGQYTISHTFSTDTYFLVYSTIGMGLSDESLVRDDVLVPEGEWTAFVSPFFVQDGGIGLILLLESGDTLEFLTYTEPPFDPIKGVVGTVFPGTQVTMRVEHFEDGTLVYSHSLDLNHWTESARFLPDSPVVEVGISLRFNSESVGALGQATDFRLLPGIWENNLEEVWIGPEDVGRAGLLDLQVEPTINSTAEPYVHGIVGAQFGDLEFDVGKSVRWLSWYVDNLFILDVNLGTPRYWIVNWTETFPDAEHTVTNINWFVVPTEFRKEQWKQYKLKFGTPSNDEWVIFIDAHEGFSVDNRTLPNDYAFAPFRSFLWREIQRAIDAGNPYAILPYYVFLRSGTPVNVTYATKMDEIDDPMLEVLPVVQALSVPYYLPYQGLKRLWNVAELEKPNFDWSQLDTPIAPEMGPLGTGSSVRNTTGAYIEGPDLASIAGATKLTVEVDVSMDDWTPVSHGLLIGQVLSGNQSWYLLAASSGVPNFFAYLTSAGGPTTYTGPAYGFVDGSRHTLSATWTASNGANSTVQHKKDGANLGSLLTGPVFPSGLTNSPQKITIGREAVGANTVIGNFYGARIYVNDVLVASPDFTKMVAGQTSVTDAQGNVWTLGGTAAVANPVPLGPLAKAQIISYGYAHWNLQDIEPPQTEVPPLTEANDDGWRMRQLLSMVRRIPGLPTGVWVPPASDPAGLPGPWAPADANNPDPIDPATGNPMSPPVPSHPSLEGLVTPLYDCVFRLNMRDGVWYEAGLSGNIPLYWDGTKWTTDYDPALWASQGVRAFDPTAVP